MPVELHGGAARVQVEPAGDQNGAGRERQLVIADRNQGCQGEARTGGLATHDDPIGMDTLLLDQPSIHSKRVFERRRKRMLRSQAVVGSEDAHPARDAEAREEVPMGVDRAGRVAATVEVEHDAVGVTARLREPLGRHRTRSDGLHADLAHWLGDGSRRIDHPTLNLKRHDGRKSRGASKYFRHGLELQCPSRPTRPEDRSAGANYRPKPIRHESDEVHGNEG